MTESPTISKPNNAKMLIAMVGIGLICGLLIVLTYENTLPRIERLREEALQNAIFKVIPGISNTKAFIYDGKAITSTDEKVENVIYAGYDDNGKFKGVAIEASGQGYADIIRILYGYDPVNQKVIGFYVLESKETPGLGDKIEKDEFFLDNFSQLDVALSENSEAIINKVITVKKGTKTNPWEVDGITGATISSRAIGEIIGNSTQEMVPLIHQKQEVFINRSDNE